VPSRESTPLIVNSPTPTECALDPELTDFCSRFHITPVTREFDENDSDLDHFVSDQSSDIEDESELKTFIQAFRMGQIAALKNEKKNKRGMYSKRSKRTLKRHKEAAIESALKGFLPLDQYISLKGIPKRDEPTPELDNAVVQEEPEASSDEANTLGRDTCTHSEVNGASDMESDNGLAQLRLTHHMRMESEESGDDMESNNGMPQLRLTHHMRMESEESGDDDGDGVGDYARQHISEEKPIIDDNETHTTSSRLEDIRHKATLARQEMSQNIPDSTSQILGDQAKLREASAQLTKEAKNSDLDVIVRGRIAAIIGLLNIYTDEALKYSWTRASEVVAKMQKRGANRARCIREWAMGFLMWRDLPLHQLNQKRGAIVDDEDIAEEIKAHMKEKATRGYLKAQDVVEIVASPKLQEIFERKGISKPSISVRTALRWLEKLGWTYGKLKHGMYLDGHERSDVVEYRQAFVERWMRHELRFHRWDHDGTELPRPNGFPVPGAIGRFHLILVTHDESTFFQNDERTTGWNHATSKSKPKAKGNGQSLMVSDFLTPDWGRLRDGDE
jgi:hypothetical protein